MKDVHKKLPKGRKVGPCFDRRGDPVVADQNGRVLKDVTELANMGEVEAARKLALAQGHAVTNLGWRIFDD